LLQRYGGLNKTLLQRVQLGKYSQKLALPLLLWLRLGETLFLVTNNDKMHLRSMTLQVLPPPITRADFNKVLARQKPTVSKADLEVHERFTKEFGEEG
jgi:SpoVK/Ycf46/Vps4 family AAA+-type ATPase